jgi:hypothetical protein
MLDPRGMPTSEAKLRKMRRTRGRAHPAYHSTTYVQRTKERCVEPVSGNKARPPVARCLPPKIIKIILKKEVHMSFS